jgi:hypothetical protein
MQWTACRFHAVGPLSGLAVRKLAPRVPTSRSRLCWLCRAAIQRAAPHGQTAQHHLSAWTLTRSVRMLQGGARDGDVQDSTGMGDSTWCWEVDSQDNESIDGVTSPPASLLHVTQRPADVAALVAASKRQPPRGGIDWLADIQPFVATAAGGSSGGGGLMVEHAEWWGSECDSESEHERLASMTPVWPSACLRACLPPQPH